MNLIKLLIFTLFLFNNSYSYIVQCNNKYNVCRRKMISLFSGGALLLKNKIVNAHDRPLTEEEMIEYNKLLEEAKRIQNIIDINIKAADEEFNKIENNLKKNSTLYK